MKRPLPEGYENPENGEEVRSDWLNWCSVKNCWKEVSGEMGARITIPKCWARPLKLDPPEGWELVPWDDKIIESHRFWCSDGDVKKTAPYVSSLGSSSMHWQGCYDIHRKQGSKGGCCYIRKVKEMTTKIINPPDGYELVPWNDKVQLGDRFWDGDDDIDGGQAAERCYGSRHVDWKDVYERGQGGGEGGGCFVRRMAKVAPPEGYELIPWDESIQEGDRWWTDEGKLSRGASSARGLPASEFKNQYKGRQNLGRPGGCYVRKITETPVHSRISLKQVMTLITVGRFLWKYRK